MLRRPHLAWAGLLAALSVPAAIAAETPPDKTFVLFMGADIDVQQGQTPYRVKNVAGDAFVINVGEKPVEVPMNRGKINMKVSPQLKLSDKVAVVKELKFERGYTPENDPRRKWGGVESASAGQAGVGNAAAQLGNALRGAAIGQANGAALAGPTASGGPPPPDPAVTGALNRLNQATTGGGSDLSNPAWADMKLHEELDKKLFDAVRVSFEISAPKPMRDPYVVIITQYREQDDPPGAVKNWVYAWQLERLDETPMKIRLLKGGFPPGFEMLKQQVHVYGAGRELGTNVAEKNVALTRDEAHEYIVVDHLVAHKGQTLAPTVALGVSHKDFFPHFASVQLEQPIFVKVDKNGRPVGAFRDERCTETTGDTYLESLVAQARFKPALQAGKAVESVAKLKIADLAI